MTLSTSILSFPDAKDLFEKALEAENAVRVTCKTETEAVILRHRLNRFRSLSRKDNKDLYPKDHTMYGRSVYDPLLVRKDGPVIIIEKIKPILVDVEIL